jgi:hypothetical protein
VRVEKGAWPDCALNLVLKERNLCVGDSSLSGVS